MWNFKYGKKVYRLFAYTHTLHTEMKNMIAHVTAAATAHTAAKPPANNATGHEVLAPRTFTGVTYRLPNNWFRLVPLAFFQQRPIKYLEIGTFHGANLLAVAETYAAHPDSELHCIDPWTDYAEYPEYRGQQTDNYSIFCNNVANSPAKDRIRVHRGFSNAVVPTLDDDCFDIVYIDGNHEPEYVLEDAVLCFRKLKVGGVMIFDDYGWGGPDLTKKGIDGFLSGYHKRIKVLGGMNMQVFVRKLS